jgi:shikimate kinase
VYWPLVSFCLMSVVLIGMMGSGKTTLGREAAKRIGFRFVDLDRVIERDSGKSISQIFATDGESVFRDMEIASLRQLSKRKRQIVAVGGGTPMRSEAWDVMRSIGPIVYLRASADTLVRRLKKSKTPRPLLEGVDLSVRVEKLLMERGPVYEQADVILEVDMESRFAVIDSICKAALQSP